jgi:ABC-type antimicrobial peptide transport system permease subunit
LSATFRPLALGALAAGLLIAMACLANVMNLLVAHGVYRSQDFATRRALGASDVDLIRLIGLEMAAIGLVTAGAGLLAARFGLTAIAQIMPAEYGALGQPAMTSRVALFTGTLTLDRGWDAVVVNRSFAQRAWPDLSVHEVVGQPITRNGQPGRVVGIVGDMYTRALDVPPGPRLYQPIDAPTGPRRLSFAVRLVEGASVPETAIRRAVTAVDADAVVEQVDSAYGRLADSVRDRTFAALVLGLFAIAGVGVTAAGIFAVVAFVAARRTREIAIRVALGARSADVQRLVVRDAVLATAAGGAVGLTASRWLGRAIESQLYGVTAEGWTTPLLAIAVLVGVTALAAWWPAKRALAVPPTAALRVE